MDKTESPSKVFMCGVSNQSDQASRSLCLKGHVRARGSTLWQHRWQEASEFFCTKTPLFWESWATKNIAKKTNALSDALLLSCFQNFVPDAAKKTPRSARFLKTALRTVLINELIRINSGPKILRKLFYSLPDIWVSFVFWNFLLLLLRLTVNKHSHIKKRIEAKR